MDDDIRAALDALLHEMRQGFAEVHSGMAEVHSGMAEMRSGMAEVHSGMAEVHSGMAEVDHRFAAITRELREHGILIEDLRGQIQLVAEGVGTNGRAIERLRAEMHERFRENEIIVGGAFRQIRHDLDELRDRG